MPFLKILILAVIQGAAELLPVSSSAHVIVAAKLMGLDPSSPEMTMLLILLHTGTIFAVIAYFWKAWRQSFFSSAAQTKAVFIQVAIATACTGVVGLGLKVVIEKVFMRNVPHAEIEDLFSNLPLVASALGAVGLLIIYAGLRSGNVRGQGEIQTPHSCWIGIVQGLALPFRGFSRSGSTISTGLILGLPKQKVEEFSFALAVVLTPPLIVLEAHRLLKASAGHAALTHLFTPGLVGMVFSFLSGLLALKWLSQWLENGQWKLFGFYCVVASAAVFALHFGMGL